MLGSAERRKVRLMSVKLFSKNSNACDHTQSTNVTDGRTDGPTDGQTDNLSWQYPLRYASRGKNLTDASL